MVLSELRHVTRGGDRSPGKNPTFDGGVYEDHSISDLFSHTAHTLSAKRIEIASAPVSLICPGLLRYMPFFFHEVAVASREVP
jgi:hypothetical protein